IGRAAQRHTQHRAESLQMLGGSFLDTLQGLPTLRVFGRGAAQAGRLRDTSARLRRTVMATLRIAFLSAFVLELLASLGTALLAVSIALRLVGGDLSLRGGLTVLVLAPEAYLPLRALAASFHTSRDGVEAARRLDHLTQTQTNQARVPHPLRLDRDTAAIALRDVTFAHPGGAALLVDVSLRVRAGERVVITGPSGAGKSTLLGLIAAQLAPDAGTLSVAPEPVSWLPQHPHVFSGTIAANVRLGNPGLSDADIEEWLARMDLHFACSAGTETGERGVRLSRGQRQRVALIRVLVRGSPMVLLDEPL